MDGGGWRLKGDRWRVLRETTLFTHHWFEACSRHLQGLSGNATSAPCFRPACCTCNAPQLPVSSLGQDSSVVALD